MKQKILDIIDSNYDPDIDFLDKDAIANEIIELVGWKKKYKIGDIDDPFDELIPFEER